MKKYTFRSGRHDARPISLPRLMRGSRGRLSASFRFTPECWFDWRLENGTQDSDVYDWNYKLLGAAPLLEPGNWNGVVFAARPKADEQGVLEFTFYQNVDKGNFPNENERFSYRIDELDRITVNIWPSAKAQLTMEVIVYLKSGLQSGVRDNHLKVYAMPKNYSVYRELFLWFGGQNNAEGRFGGVPDRDIDIYAEKN